MRIIAYRCDNKLNIRAQGGAWMPIPQDNVGFEADYPNIFISLYMKKGRSATPPHLRAEPLHLGVQRFCGCVGGPVGEIVEHVFLFAFDGVPRGKQLADQALADICVPCAQLLPCLISALAVLEYAPQRAQ